MYPKNCHKTVFSWPLTFFFFFFFFFACRFWKFGDTLWEHVNIGRQMSLEWWSRDPGFNFFSQLQGCGTSNSSIGAV